MASCRSFGTPTAVGSPARHSLARLTASRRFVFIRSPGFLANEQASHHQALVAEAVCRANIPSALLLSKTSDGGISLQAWPRALGSPPPRQGTPRDSAPRRHARQRQLLLHYAIWRIDPVKGFGMMPHDQPSLFEALASPSG
jgi:hypothetical protein